MSPGADIATSLQQPNRLMEPNTSATVTRDHAARAQAGVDRTDISTHSFQSPSPASLSSSSMHSGSTIYSHLSPAYPAPHSSSSSLAPSPSPGAAPPRFLSEVALRSSSLPFTSMGNSPSKTTPAQQSQSAAPVPIPVSKLANAAVAGNGPGFKLKRAFAARRKKSEGGSTMFASAESGREQDERQYQQTRIDQRQPKHIPTPLPLSASASSPAQVNTSHTASASHTQHRSAKQLTQLATHVFHKKSPKSPTQQETLPAPPPPPPKSARHARYPVPPSTEPVPQQPSGDAPNYDRLSIMALSPGISSAVTYMRMGDDERTEQEKRMGEADNGDKTEMKESWRKSDSTMSHHTIRPGASIAARGSRPVSMAESLQSTHTIVPVNKRRSALIGDADFGMPEEDDDSFQSLDARVPVAPPVQIRPSPASSVKTKNRRSMSLNLGSPFSKSQVQGASYGPSTSATDLKHTSISISEGVPPTPPASDHSHGFGFMAAPSQSASQNLRGRLAGWTGPGNNNNHFPPPPSHPERTLPALPQQLQLQPPSFRQTAISMTNGFAPAASGLAKRAVEKMGRAWGISSSSSGSGYSSSASSNTAPSSFSSSHMDYGLSRTSSNTSNPSVHLPMHMHPHQQYIQKGKQRRTPNAPSGSYSITSSMTSGSDSDAYLPPPGPVLGHLVRGPMRGKAGVGGVVFGKDLKTVVRETAVGVGRAEVEVKRVGDEKRTEEMRKLEERKVPALVMRCAQHLLVWGIQEEGLFRVNGRASHVTKIRVEFDTGADYDMMECTPGDLDPHAVASVFKAYLRELPEPILTQKLAPYFEAAINKETSANAAEVSNNVSAARSKAPGLPSNPRGGGGFPLPAIRKPPSLSTLAMPSFSGVPPPSKPLLNALSSLIAQLPQENRDLIQTVVELIGATAKESKETKMPLSNLLLVFCPSLNVSPPLLRVLCEAEGIWSPVSEEVTPVMDIKRESMVLDITTPSTAAAVENDDADEEYSDANDDGEEDSLQERASEDTRSGDYASSAGSSVDDADPQKRWTLRERREVPTVYLDTKSSLSSSSSVALSSRAPSHTRDTSAASSSVQDDVSLSSDDCIHNPSASSFSPPPPLSLSAESVATPPTSSGQPSLSHLPLDRPDGLYMPSKSDSEISGPPKIADTAPYALHTKARRPTINNPIPVSGPVQFPTSPESSPSSTKASKRRSIPILSLPNFSPLTSASQSPSPTDSVASHRGLRSKKPSLRLLFSKRSVSSLNGLSATGSKPFISAPVLPVGGPYMQNPGSASDSSVSTPRSVVTAPQSSVPDLPPVLDTPIEGSSLKMGFGFDVPPPSTASSPDQAQVAGYLEPGSTSSPTKRNLSPYSDRYLASSASSKTSLTEAPAPAVSHLRQHPTNRVRVSSTSSQVSSNHLGLLDDGNDREDWTQSVLLAADMNGVEWMIQRPEDV